MTFPLVLILILARYRDICHNRPLGGTPDHSKPGSILVIFNVVVEHLGTTDRQKFNIGVELEGIFLGKVFHDFIDVGIFFQGSVRISLLNIKIYKYYLR